MACNAPSSNQNEAKEPVFDQESYGHDLNFLKEHKIEVVELISEDSSQRVMLIPDWQGRVMTSSSRGLNGKSYGWINYDLINSQKKDDQFNPFGGEERFWLGPEGGPYSLYFNEGKQQVFENWKVPEFIDTKPFETKSRKQDEALFSGGAELSNASGNKLKIEVQRNVKLLDRQKISKALNTEIPDDLEYVAYQSDNTIKNNGDNAWTKDYGFVSIWMLCMFNPSPQGVVIIPVNDENKSREEILTDDYFGQVPADRLKLINGTVFFKVDGEMRSKIGISPDAAHSIAAGYDAVNRILTIVAYSGPDRKAPYVNSVWGEQENPLKGDALNAYNDGPVDGKVMGPFYEIETSSPAALLAPGESMTHIQRVFHFRGSEKSLERITSELLNLKINEITRVFANKKSQ